VKGFSQLRCEHHGYSVLRERRALTLMALLLVLAFTLTLVLRYYWKQPGREREGLHETWGHPLRLLDLTWSPRVFQVNVSHRISIRVYCGSSSVKAVKIDFYASSHDSYEWCRPVLIESITLKAGGERVVARARYFGYFRYFGGRARASPSATSFYRWLIEGHIDRHHGGGLTG